eukprot:COSAG06_NODE_4801_length_3942_cov_22.629196_3_plen_97_part_00
MSLSDVLSCDSLAPEGCSEGVCDDCCNALSHYMICNNATAIQATCAACVAHECTGAESEEEDETWFFVFLAVMIGGTLCLFRRFHYKERRRILAEI